MGIQLYRSPVIPAEGFLHGFPERGGGVSTGLRASLNLGVRWGDDKDKVDENRHLLASHVGRPGRDRQPRYRVKLDRPGLLRSGKLEG